MKKILFTFVLSITGSVLFAQDVEQAKPSSVSTADYIEFSPTVSGDGKTMVFQSNREGGFRLYESKLTTENTWSDPLPIEAINRFGSPNYLIGGPCISQDGKSLYFCAMENKSTTDMDIYISKRNNKGEWGSPSNIGSPITTKDSETFPSISPDGKTLFYTKTVATGKEEKCSKILMSKQDDKGKWMAPVEVNAPLNATCDKSPRLLYDNKTLLFASNKEGHYDLFKTEMDSSNNWSQPVALDYANTGESELNGSLSMMEDYLYYSQKGDIYYAPIPKAHKLHGIGLEGPVVDSETGKPVSGKLYIIDTLTTDTIKTQMVEGKYNIHIPAGKPYKVLVKVDKYYPYTAPYNALIGANYISKTTPIKMKFKTKEFVFNVNDKDNNKGLKVKIKITNVDTKEEIILDANAGRDGKYAVSLREGNKYNVEVSSIEGGYSYSTSTIDVPFTSESENIIPTSTQNTDSSTNDSTAFSTAAEMPMIDIKLQPLKDKTQLTLNDIYFQFNEFKLEESSFEELDRVVSLMKSNPSAKIEIAAHTDNVGSDLYNNALSSKRASEIVKYLKSKGVPSKQLRPVGYGSTKPIDTEDSEEARAKNRRVELNILDIN